MTSEQHSQEEKEKHGLRAILGSSTMVFGFRVLGAATAFFTQMLLARWMGAHELGVYVYAFSWLIILGTSVGLGLDAASFRVIGKALSDKRNDLICGFIQRGRLIVTSTSVLTALIAAYLIYNVEGLVNEDYKTTLLIALLMLPIYLIACLHEAVSHAFNWLYMMILPNSVIRPLLLLAMVAIAWFIQGDLDAPKVMFYQFLSMFIVTFLHYFIMRHLLNDRLSGVKPSYETRSWLRIGLPQLVPLLYISYLGEISVIMVGFFLPPDEVAIFSVAFRVALLITFMIFAVDSIFRPKAALMYADGDMEGLQRLTSQCTQLMFWPGLIFVVLFIIFGEFILGFFGEEFVVGYKVFAILSASQLIVVSYGPVASLLNVTGHQDYSMMVFSVSLVLLLILDAILTPMLGILGGAIGVAVVTAIWNIWMHYLVKKHLNIRSGLLAALLPYRSPLTQS